MITLLTGLPGNGKTLFALWYIKSKAERETREVYYHNINQLSLPWTVFDPEKWMDLPHGCIIVIDEAQDVFPKKPNGSKLPDFYSELAKHRHKGFDIYLITQHPSLIDNFVRQLCGQHFHSIRKFGLQRSTIYEWSSANPAPQSVASQKSAIPLKWKYPKEVFSYYKSAEVHTVKRAIPAKLILAVLFVLAVIGAGYYAMTKYKQRYEKPADAVASPAALPAATGGGSGGAVPGGVLSPMEDARRYVYANTPRVIGLPHTAPKYDQITKPVRAPIPAMCIATSDKCKCFSQQSTPMAIEQSLCREFAQHGYFLDFDPESDRRQSHTDRVVSSRDVVRSEDPAPVVSFVPHNPKDYDVSSYK